MQGPTSACAAPTARHSLEKEARTAKRVQDSRLHSNKEESYSRQEEAEKQNAQAEAQVFKGRKRANTCQFQYYDA